MTRDSNFQRAAQPLYINEIAELRVLRVDRTGGINLANPVASFSQLMLLNAQEQDGERTQVALSSDATKLYSFGRQHRFFTYQAFILDSDLDSDIQVNTDSLWTGRSYTEWRTFFENSASLSACARNRTLVQLSYPSKKLYGAINQMSVSNAATEPHKYDIVFSFYVTHTNDLNVG